MNAEHRASQTNPPVDLDDSPWRLIGRMLRLSLADGWGVAGVVLIGSLLAASRYLRIWLIQPLLDEVLTPIMTGALTLEAVAPALSEIGGLAALTLVAAPIAVFGRGYYAEWISGRVRQRVDVQVARKFLHVPLRVFRQGSSGDFLARSMADLQIACRIVTVFYKDVVLNVQMVLGGLTLMLWQSWELTLIALVGVPPLVGVMAWLMGRIVDNATRRQESQGELSDHLIAILSGIKVIKAFRGEEVEQQAFDGETTRYFRKHMKVMKNGALVKAFSEASYPIIGVLVIATGGYFVAEDLFGFTSGRLVAFAGALFILYKPIKSLTRSFPQLLESAGSAARLFEVLDLEEELADRPEARPMTGLARSIRFRDLAFDYGEGPVLDGIDLEVTAGEVVAIVGRTGAGKSTLVELVLRFHDPTRGAIEIDGVDLRDLQRGSFLDQVAIVTQEPFLFDESIRENIRYGRPQATEEEVRAAAEAAAAHEFIEALPEGYDTLAGEFGLRLSGGQRQRITIARAILANPAILVFDEATSALDAQTERAVQEAIEGLRGRRTIFLVAHRLSTIERADRIVVLDAGRIAEVGDHASLLAQRGIYSELLGVQAAQAS